MTPPTTGPTMLVWPPEELDAALGRGVSVGCEAQRDGRTDPAVGVDLDFLAEAIHVSLSVLPEEDER